MNLHWSSDHPWNRSYEFGSGFGDVIVSREYSESVTVAVNTGIKCPDGDKGQSI